MGWFLSRSGSRSRTRKPKRTKRPAASGASAKWDPRRTLLALKVIAVGGAMVGSVYGWGWLRGELTAYATATRARPVVVELAARPAWMSDSAAAKLRSTAAENLTDDPMDRVALAKAAAALERNPWIDRVTQVRRATDGRVIVEAAYRRPSAVIRSDHGFYVVDAQGVWLPTDDRALLRELPVVIGVVAAPPGAQGDAWRGEDVEAALALVNVLADEPYMTQVSAIDASHRDARGRVKLVLHTPESWVVWGLAPGQEKMAEPEADVKLSRLRKIVRTSGTVDAAGKGVYLNGATIMTARAER